MPDIEFTQFKERVKQLVPIEEIVSERVAGLKRAGSSWKACCPFHQEHTPSFVVNPERGTWHCFGACGSGGDALDFIMRFDGLDFMQALEALADRVGLEMPRRAPVAGGREAEQAPLHDCLAEAGRMYQRCLRSSAGRGALAYLRGRGLSDPTLDAFGLGYSAEGQLRELARTRNWSTELLESVGLIRRADDGRCYEFFRGRVMIPIRDRSGRVLGFGARTLALDQPGPKYLNSGETRLFHKGRLIYGLDRALAHIRRAHHVILVEGYTDVMAFHQAGIGNAVAVLGSALTADHAALIRQSGARRVTCFFDGDEAGRKATWKALHGLLPLELEIDVAVPPEGSDPGDFLGAGRADELGRLLARPRDWLAFLTEPLRGQPSRKLAEGVGQLLELLARLSQPVHREARLKELAGLVDLPLHSLQEQAGRSAASVSARARASARVEPTRAAPERPSRERMAWEGLLGDMLADNSLLPLYVEWLERCADPELTPIARLMLELSRDPSDMLPIDGNRLLTHLDDHPLHDKFVVWEERARERGIPAEDALGQVRTLKEIEVERDRCERKIQGAEISGAEVMEFAERKRGARAASQTSNPR